MSQTEDSLLHLTICPKCGRFVNINRYCECETTFFVYPMQSKKKKNPNN